MIISGVYIENDGAMKETTIFDHISEFNELRERLKIMLHNE